MEKSKHKLIKDQILIKATAWFNEQEMVPFPFQQETWEAYLSGQSGLVNAPTGSGKTYSLLIPILLDQIPRDTTGIKAIWVTPIRALAKEIKLAADRICHDLTPDKLVNIRTGDTSWDERQEQWKKPPHLLITTPESIQILLSTPGYISYLGNLEAIVLDEWHELMGSKRGVQMELALSRLKTLCPSLKIWGISATIGNLPQAMEVLFGNWYQEVPQKIKLIRADLDKQIVINTIIPENIHQLPWTGHLGTRLIREVIQIILQHQTTLVFTNTRGQAEIWYQRILDSEPSLSGLMALHHGSLSREIREWVEDSIHAEKLKAVICTSSLDLGVDFQPVECIIQIGSPKGVARFMQRAGRSGHRPGIPSTIYFLPTHAMELVEGAALKEAILRGKVEDRLPYVNSFDVLMQYLVTLACSDGFDGNITFQEILRTFSFAGLPEESWHQVLSLVVHGGRLEAYDEYKRIGKDKKGRYRVVNKSIAIRHRLSIGTIVGENQVTVKLSNGKSLGQIEESFISKLNPGDTFWFAGKNLELTRTRENLATVRLSKSGKGNTPSWMGGRMPLSSQLSSMIRFKIHEYVTGVCRDVEMLSLDFLFDVQQKISLVPSQDQFLMEYFRDREGYHLLLYPFEGRFVHEGLGALLAYRISRLKPITFSIAMNDYGLELLSDQDIPLNEALQAGLFATNKLQSDILASVNAAEMARKKFREIASIAGFVFKGYPGRLKKERHLRSSTSLLFDVFRDYDPDNLLFLQAFEEVLIFQLEEQRLRQALWRIESQEILIRDTKGPTPFSLPVITDRLRERLSSEQLEARINRMQMKMQKFS